MIIKITQLEKFVDQIGGINQKIGEDGIRISGGQRQKIGIARALYKRASILVLDEATSALDNQTEEFIMDNIQNLEREMTKIMIAHRIRSLKNCDRIIKIENGKLIKHS